MNNLSRPARTAITVTAIAAAAFVFLGFRNSDAVADKVLGNIGFQPAGFKFDVQLPPLGQLLNNQSINLILKPKVRITNNNAFPLPQVYFAGMVKLQGRDVANINSVAPITIPANGSAVVDLESIFPVSQIESLVQNVQQIIQTGRFNINVGINGTVSTSVGTFNTGDVTIFEV